MPSSEKFRFRIKTCPLPGPWRRKSPRMTSRSLNEDQESGKLRKRNSTQSPSIPLGKGASARQLSQEVVIVDETSVKLSQTWITSLDQFIQEPDANIAVISKPYSSMV